ncbi:MAG TPA: hypothetical protein DF613_07385 [Lachnospiraceae bacterium]|nr:hypothetical protein [Lachnospiraceae bacterium]
MCYTVYTMSRVFPSFFIKEDFMNKIKRFSLLLCALAALTLSVFLPARHIPARTPSLPNLVILSHYKATMDVGDSLPLLAIASNGQWPTFKSSKPSVAYVDAYGIITAKKAGTATITVKVRRGEAHCKITVRKTKLLLSETSISLVCGDYARLKAKASNGTKVSFKSSKSSVASVDERGVIYALKPGSAKITASAGDAKAVCTVNIKHPTLRLNRNKATLYRTRTLQLTAEASNGHTPVWKSSKTSVATVDEDGLVTAVGHGTANITATVDGVKRYCKITVKQPTITLSKSTLKLTVGEKATLTCRVSSGISPLWASTNAAVAYIMSDGDFKVTVTARKAGNGTVVVTEDGVRVRCKIIVKER